MRVLTRPGCTGRASITPACWSLLAGGRVDIRTVPTRFSVDLFIQSQRSRLQFIDPLHFLAWISWSQLSSYSSYGTRVISLNPLLIPSLFLHLSWWRFYSSLVWPLFTPPALHASVSRSQVNRLVLYWRMEVWMVGLVHLVLSSWSPLFSSIFHYGCFPQIQLGLSFPPPPSCISISFSGL